VRRSLLTKEEVGVGSTGLDPGFVLRRAIRAAEALTGRWIYQGKTESTIHVSEKTVLPDFPIRRCKVHGAGHEYLSVDEAQGILTTYLPLGEYRVSYEVGYEPSNVPAGIRALVRLLVEYQIAPSEVLVNEAASWVEILRAQDTKTRESRHAAAL